MNKLALFLVLLMSTVPADADEPKTVTIGKIVWYTDYDQALAAAKKQKKPLFLHFGENPG